jgi:hypothetical protein
MKRLPLVLMMLALALPLAVLGLMVADAERARADAGIIRVAIRGYDPRDPLRGHYLRYQFDWNAETPFIGEVTRLCVLSAPVTQPARVRPLNDMQASTAQCVLILNGRGQVLAEARRTELGETGSTGRLQFTPKGVESGRLYVPEEHARELEQLLSEDSVRLTIDLAVRRDGHASIQAWHIDGKRVEAFFAR